MYLHIYKNNPTAAGTDGTQVSEDGTQLTPISIGPLSATNNEVSAAVALAIRCDTGYVTAANIVITPTGTDAAMWALSADGTTWGAYGAALTITSVINTTNTLFYARAKAASTENPHTDTTVSLVVTCAVINAA